MNSRFGFWEPNGRQYLVFWPQHYLMIVSGVKNDFFEFRNSMAGTRVFFLNHIILVYKKYQYLKKNLVLAL